MCGKTNLGINPGHFSQLLPTHTHPSDVALLHLLASFFVAYLSPHFTIHIFAELWLYFPSSPRLCPCHSLYMECPSPAGSLSEFPFMPQILKQVSPPPGKLPWWPLPPAHSRSCLSMQGCSHDGIDHPYIPWHMQGFWNCSRHQNQLKGKNLHF